MDWQLRLIQIKVTMKQPQIIPILHPVKIEVSPAKRSVSFYSCCFVQISSPSSRFSKRKFFRTPTWARSCTGSFILLSYSQLLCVHIKSSGQTSKLLMLLVPAKVYLTNYPKLFALFVCVFHGKPVYHNSKAQSRIRCQVLLVPSFFSIPILLFPLLFLSNHA